MRFFVNTKERRLWTYAALVVLAIASTLIIGRPIIDWFQDQNVQALIFVGGMFLTATTMVIHGLRAKAGKWEVTIWIGLAAVYMMLFLRLGLPERSHLMEYSVLAIFIHLALIERLGADAGSRRPAFLAFILTVSIGIGDEVVQYFLPDRVFHTDDILFNAFAAFAAIVSSLFLQWIRNRKKSKEGA